MDDNKRLMDEIDKLDDEHEPNKEGISDNLQKEDDPIKTNKTSSIIIIVLLVLIVVIGISWKMMFKDESVISEGGFDVLGESGTLKKSETTLGDLIELYEEDEVDEEEYQKIKQDFYEDRKNIAVENEYKDINNNLILKIKNNSQKQFENLNAYIVFYAGDNTIIEVDNRSIYCFASNSEMYLTFENTPDAYERYQICFSKDYFDENMYVSRLNDVSIEDVKIDNESNTSKITLKNNSKDVIENVTVNVIYYDENKMIRGVEEIQTFDLDNKSTEELFGLYNEAECKYEDIVDYEVLVTEAY